MAMTQDASHPDYVNHVGECMTIYRKLFFFFFLMHRPATKTSYVAFNRVHRVSAAKGDDSIETPQWGIRKRIAGMA